MIPRRELLIAVGLGALAAPLARFARAQQPKLARIGVLEATSASGYAISREALIVGLRELGYLEGKNIAVEYRWADGQYDRLPLLAAELVRMKVDVIVTGGYQAISAVQRATTTIPVVMVRTSDPVGHKFVASLSRPGRNITGLSNINVEVIGKHVELLRAAVPKLSRVTVLVNPDHPGHPNFLKRIEATAQPNGVTISPVRVGTASQIVPAFEAMVRAHPGALIVLPDSFYGAQGARIAELAIQHRLPAMFGNRESVEAGGLMSYGQDLAEHYYRAAAYIDKILKGAKPAELPVEQPTKIELVINLKTAKAIGLAIPQALLFRADKVIE